MHNTTMQKLTILQQQVLNSGQSVLCMSAHFHCVLPFMASVCLPYLLEQCPRHRNINIKYIRINTNAESLY